MASNEFDLVDFSINKNHFRKTYSDISHLPKRIKRVEFIRKTYINDTTNFQAEIPILANYSNSNR